MNFFSRTRVRVRLFVKDALVRPLDIPNRHKSLTGLKSYFKVTIKCLSSPNTVFCLILLFFLKRMSHRIPIRSNPANTPSDTYMNWLMKGDDASNRSTFLAGLCSVSLRKQVIKNHYHLHHTYELEVKLTDRGRFTKRHWILQW